MGIDTREGLEAAAAAVLYTLSDAMPAAIATLNATESATARAPLAGPYVLAASKTLILTAHGGEAATFTVSATTYTATTLAAALNAMPAFVTAGFEAFTFMGSDFLAIRMLTKGEAGAITIGNGTINTTLGLVNGQVFRHHPLPDVDWYKVADTEDDTPKYPSIVVWNEGQSVDADEGAHQIVIRVRTANVAYTAGATAEAIRQAWKYAEMIKQAIEDSADLHEMSDGHWISSVTPKIEGDLAAKAIRGVVDISMMVNIEEE